MGVRHGESPPSGTLAAQGARAVARHVRAGVAGSRPDPVRHDRDLRSGGLRCAQRPAAAHHETRRSVALDVAQSVTARSPMMRTLDQMFERSTRSLAQRTSRRSLLASIGQLLTGAALLPLLPVDRANRARAAETKPRADS